jgi:hypothetical protein
MAGGAPGRRVQVVDGAGPWVEEDRWTTGELLEVAAQPEDVGTWRSTVSSSEKKWRSVKSVS